jgi:nucleoside-diphosphate-sugar epimerase
VRPDQRILNLQQVRERKYPIIGSGQGVWSWVHVEDAAAATVAALECDPGIYNIVDDDPSELAVWLHGSTGTRPCQ